MPSTHGARNELGCTRPKIDVSSKTKLQYAWAAGHIRSGLGGVRLDQLERHDVARWLEALAQGGKFSRRSIQIMRTVLRAALEDAVAQIRQPALTALHARGGTDGAT